MLTFEEISELESSDSGETKHMEEYLETFDTSLQSETPYSDVTQVSKKNWHDGKLFQWKALINFLKLLNK